MDPMESLVKPVCITYIYKSESIGIKLMTRIKPYPLRMPDELREYFTEKSEQSVRSLNNELLFRITLTQQLEEYLGMDADQIMGTIIRMKEAADEKEKYQYLYADAHEKLNTLTRELGTAFALSGDERGDIAIRKIKKAFTYISSGLSELESLIQDKK